jgi:NADH-quinone oxidoreductase subunit N
MISWETIAADLGYLYPEIVLMITMLVVMIAEIIPGTNKRLVIPFLSLAGLLVSMSLTFPLLDDPGRSLFSGMMVVDHFGVFFKIFFAFSSIIIVFLSLTTFQRSGEYYTLLLAATVGMYFMASSTHIVMIAISLEIVGIASYVLAGFRKNELRSSEASLKFMLYGAVSTGIMLYGFSFLYGISGEGNIYAIRDYIVANPVNDLLLFVSVLFVMAGIGYKITMVPFHFWCPDVYEGAPTPVTTFFSVGPKVAGIALMIRFVYAGLSTQIGGTELQWQSIGTLEVPLLLAGLSAVTMTIGNLAALQQTNLKRLLAYSSIAHAGYILMGFTMLNGDGLNAILFYSVVYLFMNFGAFVIVDGVALKIKSEDISRYQGLGFRSPYVAFAFIIFLMSLTGIPPTAGFIGKVLIFAAVIKSNLYWLAVVGALNAAISLFYYFKIAKAMYMTKPEEGFDKKFSISRMHTVLVTALLIPTIILGIFWDTLHDWTQYGIEIMQNIN